MLETVTEDAPKQTTNEVGVELASDEPRKLMRPMDYAKYLCDKAELTLEQRGPVALVTRDMQQVYDGEVARRAKLTNVQLQAEASVL